MNFLSFSWKMLGFHLRILRWLVYINIAARCGSNCYIVREECFRVAPLDFADHVFFRVRSLSGVGINLRWYHASQKLADRPTRTILSFDSSLVLKRYLDIRIFYGMHIGSRQALGLRICWLALYELWKFLSLVLYAVVGDDMFICMNLNVIR